MVPSGLRGVGKTVLLPKWRSQAEAALVPAARMNDAETPERGVVAFTVPHMSPYLRSLATHEFSDD